MNFRPGFSLASSGIVPGGRGSATLRSIPDTARPVGKPGSPSRCNSGRRCLPRRAQAASRIGPGTSSTSPSAITRRSAISSRTPGSSIACTMASGRRQPRNTSCGSGQLSPSICSIATPIRSSRTEGYAIWMSSAAQYARSPSEPPHHSARVPRRQRIPSVVLEVLYATGVVLLPDGRPCHLGHRPVGNPSKQAVRPGIRQIDLAGSERDSVGYTNSAPVAVGPRPSAGTIDCRTRSCALACRQAAPARPNVP